MSVTGILAVDDFVPFRGFVAFTLESEADLHLIGEASDGVSGVQRLTRCDPIWSCSTSVYLYLAGSKLLDKFATSPR
jgi:hypothetical protein